MLEGKYNNILKIVFTKTQIQMLLLCTALDTQRHNAAKCNIELNDKFETQKQFFRNTIKKLYIKSIWDSHYLQ